MGKETDKKYKVMKTIMDALEDILCSYQGRGHLSAYTDLDSLALFASLVSYGQIWVENYQYDFDDDIREDREAVQIYQELAPQTRWRVGQHTQIEAMRMNAFKQLAGMGTPVFEEQIYYKDTASALVCGEILPYEVFQLFTDTAKVKGAVGGFLDCGSEKFFLCLENCFTWVRPSARIWLLRSSSFFCPLRFARYYRSVIFFAGASRST